jgi:hypothetical protein
MSTREYRFEELEVYRTALEFRRIAWRIVQALPARKRDMKESLGSASAGIVNEIVGAAAEDSENVCFRGAHAPLSMCQHLLDQLSIINLGGKADVTAGIEILERIAEMLGQTDQTD